MNERAPLRPSAQLSALLAQFSKRRSRIPAVVGALTYVIGFANPATRDLPRVAVAAFEAETFLTWPRMWRFSGAPS